jgi:predicted dehydrogenase
MRVKIHGAGSIGNHLANASRRLGWQVDICDVDPAALERTRTSLYPGRYGAWDPAIGLHESAKAPKGGYDLICIGTPPDHHLPLAMAALEEKPRAIQIEKPLCKPDLAGLADLAAKAGRQGVRAYVGYDHVVGLAAELAQTRLAAGQIGRVQTIDVEFREHWGGIFAAHPWLAGPHDSYLGFWQRGGGATGEHSHAINFWQFLAHVAGAGRVAEVQATLDYVSDGRVDYDRLAVLNLRTEGGLLGRVVQDVVTVPHRKWARVQGERGSIEWTCGLRPGFDAVRWWTQPGREGFEEVAKTRPDDFIRELQHIEADLAAGAAAVSPLSLSRGIETMLVIAAAHQSARTGQRVRIDHARLPALDALLA